jgi:hypothetical protein
MTTSHPLANVTQAQLEAAIAQALSELSGRSAQVTLQGVTHSPMYLDSSYSKLQVTVQFAQLNPEVGEDLPVH